MPPWLLVLLGVAGCVLVTGLLAAGAMGSWRAFPLAMRQFALVLCMLAAPAVLVLIGLFIFAS
jgi:hypothetical protein